MLAMLSEDVFYKDLGIKEIESSQGRVIDFFDGSYVYGFKNWTVTNHVLEGHKYSNAYSFGAFLARNYGGAALIREINTNEFVDEESVVRAVNKINGTNKTFDDLLKEFPLFLINIDNADENLPSLNKSTSDTIGGFVYTLDKIHPDNFIYDIGLIRIMTNNPDYASEIPLHAYGFQFYNFVKKADVSVNLKNSLLHTTK